MMTEDITSNMTHHLCLIPNADLQKCFQQRQEHWNKCGSAEREYLMGINDEIDI
jgi:hypothetical protein